MSFLFGPLYVHPIISVSRQERAVAAEQFANLPSSSAIQPSTTFLEKKPLQPIKDFALKSTHNMVTYVHVIHFPSGQTNAIDLNLNCDQLQSSV